MELYMSSLGGMEVWQYETWEWNDVVCVLEEGQHVLKCFSINVWLHNGVQEVSPSLPLHRPRLCAQFHHHPQVLLETLSTLLHQMGTL